MEDLSSPMGAFVRDRCVVGPAHEVPCDDLYQAWRQWCQDHGRDRPGTTQTFGRDLRAVLPGIKVERPRIGGEARLRKYLGIALRGGEYNSEVRGPSRTRGPDDGVVRDGPRSRPMYSAHGNGDDREHLGVCPVCRFAVYRDNSTQTGAGAWMHPMCARSRS